MAIVVATLLLHTGREASTAAISSGRKITEAEALRARRDMVYAQHQVGWALDRLCEMDGARWVYDSDQLGAIRRDVMTILTHHAASRQAAIALWPHATQSRRQVSVLGRSLSARCSEQVGFEETLLVKYRFSAPGTSNLQPNRGAVATGAGHEAARAGLGFAAVDRGDAEPEFIQDRLLPA